VKAPVDPQPVDTVVEKLVIRHPERVVRGDEAVSQKLDGSIGTALESGDPSGRPAASTAPAAVAPGAPHGARRTLDTVIGTGAHLEGRLTAEGTVRIHGSVQGELISSETIVIEKSGQVIATVTAAQVVVAGQIEGQVRGSERVELRPTARVRGELHAHVLVIQEGAAFEGRASIMNPVTGFDCRLRAVEPAN
jgi:cytoskeletal protein CcmA (bactofilin family)